MLLPVGHAIFQRGIACQFAGNQDGTPVIRHTPFGKIQYLQRRHAHVMQHHQVLEFAPEG